MGKIKKTKKKSKQSSKQVDYNPVPSPDVVIGWDSSCITTLASKRDSRLLKYTKAVRQEAINDNMLTNNKLSRVTDSVFDSLSAINKSIASGKVEDARLKARIDINQDALERTDRDLHKLTHSVSSLGLKTSQNSEAIMALVDRSKSMSQDIKNLQIGLIIAALITAAGLIVTLLK